MRGPCSLSPFTAAAHCSGAGQRQQRCYARLGNRLTLDRELRIAGISCIPSAFHMVEELRPGCCDPGPIGGFVIEKLLEFRFFKWVGTANAMSWRVGSTYSHSILAGGLVETS